jgi:beta-glucanase (GH16 family)
MAATNSLGAAEPWELVWSDEFDQPGAPDLRRWTNEVGFIRNGEAQYYTAGRLENARVENGRLVLEARKERFLNPRHSPGSRDGRSREFADYTSASLTTKGLAAWRCGRIEVRAKLPSGRGVWPAIWMLGTNISSVGWPRCGEIDIMEYVGFDPNLVHANVHTTKYNHVKRTGKGSKLRVDTQDFHVFAVERHAERMDFFVDNQKYFTYAKEAGAGEDSWPFDKPCYLILNLAIGGTWGGQKGIDDAIFPQRFEVDYVRVYEAK